jgi:hypothetical protein
MPEAAWTHAGFDVALARVALRPEPAANPSLQLTLEVVHGTATQPTYMFPSLPVMLGRGVEVRDSRHQLLRVNHVAFTENGSDVNKSVSRRHARIEMDPQTGARVSSTTTARRARA